MIDSENTCEFNSTTANVNSQLLPSKDCSLNRSSHVMNKFLLNENVTRAEILWCLQNVMSHSSFRSAASAASLFPLMFSDSEIACKFKMQRTKFAYSIVYGIAPYLSQCLQNLLKSCNQIVIGFDEALNKIAQRQQMDLNVWFWNRDKQEVSCKYFSSVFLGHTKAVDLLDGIKNALAEENLKKIIQVSMDGPNVNFKLHTDLSHLMKDIGGNQLLLEMGSCGLHVVHGSFKTGVNKSGWTLVSFLRSAYNLFKNVPARRADYIVYTESNLFPSKFCTTRWIENASVAEKAQKILPQLTEYVKCAMRDKKVPKTESFEIVSKFLKDEFLGPKLAFFQSLALLLQPFLVGFQSESPMAPFVYEDLSTLVYSLLVRCVKKEVIENAVQPYDKIDLSEKSNLLFAKDIDLGFSTKSALSKLKGVKKLQILHFRQECRSILVCILQKIFEKSPLKYSLTKAITCLNPTLISKDMKIAERRLNSCLQILVEKNSISGILADRAKQEYVKLCSFPFVSEAVNGYRRSEMRLDHFWVQMLASAGEGYGNFRQIVEIILILSHGNASLERGFSVNKECLIENQQEESLIALRKVYDFVKEAGNVESVELTKNLIHHFRDASSVYRESLTKKREEENAALASEKSRKLAAEKKKDLKAKRIKILAEAQNEADLIEAEIDSLGKL